MFPHETGDGERGGDRAQKDPFFAARMRQETERDLDKLGIFGLEDPSLGVTRNQKTPPPSPVLLASGSRHCEPVLLATCVRHATRQVGDMRAHEVFVAENLLRQDRWEDLVRCWGDVLGGERCLFCVWTGIHLCLIDLYMSTYDPRPQGGMIHLQETYLYVCFDQKCSMQSFVLTKLDKIQDFKHIS